MAQFAGARDTGGPKILNFAEAAERFSRGNKGAPVCSRDRAYTRFRQPGAAVDMGALRGTWTGDDDLYPTYLRITDTRLTVYMICAAPAAQAYSGLIVERTDPSADEGYIYIQFKNEDEPGLVDAGEGDYYALRWYKDRGKTRFSVYNDHGGAVSDNLAGLRALSFGGGAFDETGDGEYGGLAASGYIYVGFTKPLEGV
jgi:hypothetical protein